MEERQKIFQILRFGILHHTQDKIRIWTDSKILIAFRYCANARVITLVNIHIPYYLEVKMWGPVAVFSWLAEAGNHFAAAEIFPLLKLR